MLPARCSTSFDDLGREAAFAYGLLAAIRGIVGDSKSKAGLEALAMVHIDRLETIGIELQQAAASAK